jgi:Flp pilus assembly protein TadD
VLSNPTRRADYDGGRGGAGTDVAAQRLANAETLYRKGEVLMHQGNFKGALEFLRPAVEGWPDEPAYCSALGWALYKKLPSEPSAARDQLRHAAELAPDDGVILFRLGMVLRSLGEQEESAALLARAKQLGK